MLISKFVTYSLKLFWQKFRYCYQEHFSHIPAWNIIGNICLLQTWHSCQQTAGQYHQERRESLSWRMAAFHSHGIVNMIDLEMFVLLSLQWCLIYLFNSLFNVTTKHTQKLCMTDPFVREIYQRLAISNNNQLSMINLFSQPCFCMFCACMYIADSLSYSQYKLTYELLIRIRIELKGLCCMLLQSVAIDL